MMPRISPGSERDDFGFRVSTGGLGGMGKTILPELSLWADFFLLSQKTRMVFGFSLLFPKTDHIPLASVHSIGIEHNISIGLNRLIVGTAYNRPLLQKKEKNYKLRKGFSYHLGYKYRIRRFEDLVIWFGYQHQLLSEVEPCPDFPLADNTYYGRLGWEWYF